ncbi:hypothetical protein JOB18_020705 [Solea senegalensis]|uniref:Retrotransposon gag domain-containing protein n=1 Tax=Solea senegalensis TaxID=28829 RepID=A0AAV6QW17_SOLSE|nr:hypothetical protein JOB18_020705 [Solea senegalensis]
MPQTYSSELNKIAFIVSYLTGRASVWATKVMDRHAPASCVAEELFSALRKVFDTTLPATEAARSLDNLHQNRDSVGEYAIRFRAAGAPEGRFFYCGQLGHQRASWPVAPSTSHLPCEQVQACH